MDDFDNTANLDIIVTLIVAEGCDPRELCHAASGVSVAEVREELHRRLGGRALAAALALLPAR